MLLFAYQRSKESSRRVEMTISGKSRPSPGGPDMKYMITWNERPQGSAMDYERAQQRILDVFRKWERPANFNIEMFVIRVGDWGGYMLADCDDPVEVHKFASMLPAFEFQARPVIPIDDAVRGELEVMAWRDNLQAA
jgi:muconolactone delta-isomerase